jgi:hypothetical protein
MWWETVAELIARRDTLHFDFGHGEEQVTCASVEEKNYTFNRFCHFVDAIFEDEAVARINALAQRCCVDPAGIVAREIMTPEEIGALSADPLCSIGAHTVTHCDLARATPTRLDAEITQSIDAVERWTGKRPTSFAYPYGFARVFGAREQAAVEKAGIRIAVTTRPGVLTQKTTQTLMAVPRVSLNGYYQNTRYVRALASGLAFRFMK